MSFSHDAGRVYFTSGGRRAEVGPKRCEELRQLYLDEHRDALRYGDQNAARIAYLLFHELQDAMRACLAHHRRLRGTT